jgi:tetratricopeptide (TPR) repeat protein
MSEISAYGVPNLVELSLEDEWPRLKTQLEIRCPWLAFAFCSSREQAVELMERTRQQVRAEGGDLELVKAIEPRDIRDLVEFLLHSPSSAERLIWIDGVATGRIRHSVAPAAWEHALLRANDHRDAIQRVHRYGTVFCLPMELKPLVREAAPDLWAKRVLTVEVDPPVAITHMQDAADAPYTPLDQYTLGVATPADPRARTKGARPQLLEARRLLRSGDAQGAAEVLEGFLSDGSGGMPVTDRADALVELASAWSVLGDFASSTHSLEQAIASGGLTQRELDRALVDLASMAAADHRPELAAASWQALVALRQNGSAAGLAGALTELARSQRAVGRLDQAVISYERAVAIFRDLASNDSASYRQGLASLLSALSASFGELGRPEEGLAVAQEAVVLYRSLAAGNRELLPDMAVSLHNLSVLLSGVGRRLDALAAAEEAVALLRTAMRDRPAALLPDTAAALNNLAAALLALGRLEDALAAAQEAAAFCRKLAAIDPDSYRPDLRVALENCANILQALGRLDEADAMRAEAGTIAR